MRRESTGMPLGMKESDRKGAENPSRPRVLRGASRGAARSEDGGSDATISSSSPKNTQPDVKLVTVEGNAQDRKGGNLFNIAFQGERRRSDRGCSMDSDALTGAWRDPALLKLLRDSPVNYLLAGNGDSAQHLAAEAASEGLHMTVSAEPAPG